MMGEKGGASIKEDKKAANDIVQEWPSENFQYLIYYLIWWNLLGFKY